MSLPILDYCGAVFHGCGYKPLLWHSYSILFSGRASLKNTFGDANIITCIIINITIIKIIMIITVIIIITIGRENHIGWKLPQGNGPKLFLQIFSN